MQASPLTFDPSAVEMFTTLSRGASLLLVPELLKMIPSQLAQIISVRHVTTIIQVGKYPTLHSVKQEFIPVGCVPPVSVAATRCQYWGEGRPPWTETPIPLDRDPHVQRPSDKDPPDRDLPDRDPPPGQRPSWTERPPPRQRHSRRNMGPVSK